MASWLPLIEVLKTYQRADFSRDLVAGVVVGVVTVPQAVAYALLAGLPPQAGLYACLVPMVAYALLGSSRELVVGPVAIAALMVAATLSAFGDPSANNYLDIAGVLCVEVAIALWLLRVSRMSGFINLLSQPVIGGFINAAVILIILSQLGAAFGVTMPHGSLLSNLAALPGLVSAINWLTLAIAVAALGIVVFFRNGLAPLIKLVSPRMPADHPVTRLGPMFASVFGVLAIVLWDWDAQGVRTVGDLPSGLPLWRWPDLPLQTWIALAPSAAMIALVSFIESYSIGSTMAMRRGRKIEPNQELVALGAANVGAALTGAYPVAGSFSRSSVNVGAGAVSPVSSLVCAVIIVLTLLYGTELFARLPHAVLAAIIIHSALPMFERTPLRRLWRRHRSDAVTSVVTFGTVLLFGVETGLTTGVLLSIFNFLRRSSRPRVTVLGKVAGSNQFRSVRRFETETVPGVTMVRVDENLYFANADYIERTIVDYALRDLQSRHVVVSCSAVNYIDFDGLLMLRRLNGFLFERGRRLHLCELKRPLEQQLTTSGFVAELSGKLHFSNHSAAVALNEVS